jgi:hypothetical protein
MKTFAGALVLIIAILAACAVALAQDPATAQQREQQNAASATKDNSATSGDQITKPAGAKGSTLIGCLAGPDKDGKFTLRNMGHRQGVQVLGPDDLKNDAGAKVKLTGKWEAAAKEGSAPETPRFQVTDIEVMAKSCSAPAETTPVSKNKKQKTTTYDAPSAPDSK